ncbi:MAG: hypothetical protein WCE80_01215, partial [Acidimicrobiia bacterium]
SPERTVRRAGEYRPSALPDLRTLGTLGTAVDPLLMSMRIMPGAAEGSLKRVGCAAAVDPKAGLPSFPAWDMADLLVSLVPATAGRRRS